MDHERIERMRAALREAELDAVVCRLPENVLMLTTYWPRSGNSYAVLRSDGDVTLIVPDGEAELAQAASPDHLGVFGYGEWARDAEVELADVLSAALDGAERVGAERNFEAVAPAFTAGEVLVPTSATRAMIEMVIGGPVADATALLYDVRGVKTSYEWEMIARASMAIQPGVVAFEAAVQLGQTEVQAGSAVESAIATEVFGLGSRHARAWAMVIGGPRTSECYRPFYPVGDRKIEPGDPALLEVGACVDGYWTDVTRMAWAGSRGEDADALLKLVAEAQARAIDALRPGALACEVDWAARRVFEHAGLGDAFLHHTGHGIGFRYHEPVPFLHPKSEQIIQAGMVTSVEPGIYGRRFGGIRLEDIVLVTEDGPRLLTQSQTSSLFGMGDSL